MSDTKPTQSESLETSLRRFQHHTLAAGYPVNTEQQDKILRDALLDIEARYAPKPESMSSPQENVGDKDTDVHISNPDVNKTTTSVDIAGKDVNEKDETAESILFELRDAIACQDGPSATQNEAAKQREIVALAALEAYYKAKYEGDEYKDALEDMVYQFAYQWDGSGNRPPSLGTGGLSALEYAFRVLGWPDPCPQPDSSCDIKRCQKWPQAGIPFQNGDYLNVCSEHSAEQRSGIDILAKKKPYRGYNAKQRAERLGRFASLQPQSQKGDRS